MGCLWTQVIFCPGPGQTISITGSRNSPSPACPWNREGTSRLLRLLQNRHKIIAYMICSSLQDLTTLRQSSLLPFLPAQVDLKLLCQPEFPFRMWCWVRRGGGTGGKLHLLLHMGRDPAICSLSLWISTRDIYEQIIVDICKNAAGWNWNHLCWQYLHLSHLVINRPRHCMDALRKYIGLYLVNQNTDLTMIFSVSRRPRSRSWTSTRIKKMSTWLCQLTTGQHRAQLWVEWRKCGALFEGFGI